MIRQSALRKLFGYGEPVEELSTETLIYGIQSGTKPYCLKCGSNDPKGDFVCNVEDLCTSCYLISAESIAKPGMGRLEEFREYIWKHGVNDNGVAWFINARDKVIMKIKNFHHSQERKEKNKKLLLKKKIDGWRIK